MPTLPPLIPDIEDLKIIDKLFGTPAMSTI
jgi:hypothetical protein